MELARNKQTDQHINMHKENGTSYIQVQLHVPKVVLKSIVLIESSNVLGSHAPNHTEQEIQTNP